METLTKEELLKIWHALPNGAVKEICAKLEISRQTVFYTLSGVHKNQDVVKACLEYINTKTEPLKAINEKIQLQAA